MSSSREGRGLFTPGDLEAHLRLGVAEKPSRSNTERVSHYAALKNHLQSK